MFDIKLLANKASVKKYSSGEIIYAENVKKSDEIFILLIGKVSIYKNYKLPHEIKLDTIIPGNVFGETNLSNDELGTHTAVSEDNSTVASITKHNLLSLAKQNNTLMLELMDILCDRINKAETSFNTENYEKNKIINKYNIDMNGFYHSVLFPANQKNYDVVQPPEFQDYIIKEQYTCPHCHEKFDDNCILTSKLISDGDISCDMRKKFKNFEPLWYEVKTCPHCYFSGLESSFVSESKVLNGEYEENIGIIHNGLKIDLNMNKDINKVFTSYYLALMCSAGFKNKKQIDSKLWLSLSWLYNDMGDQYMEDYAIGKAYEATSIMYNECDLSDELTQITLMTLGSLGRKLKKYNEAVLFLSKAMRVPNCKSVYKRLIDIEIDKIREEKKMNK